ncbi:hypothetical protein P8452_74072 [Trifolium repens]|nr:hypothetical protein P8452_74072 [Trifolium repens]
MAASNHGSGQNAIECTNTTKKGRGRTSGLGVAKKKKKSVTGKLHIDIPIDKMVAVGPGAANFVTEISIIVLKNAPFNVKKWKNIPEDIFNKIVSKVLDAFDIDNTTHNRETNEIALEHRPDDVGEDDWKFLVDYFSSPNYKVISERNKLNKAKQVINHRCGRKSFQVVSYDARDPETQKEPNYQDLWRMTHTNSNGEWIYDDSKEVHTKVQERCSELLELGYMDEDKDKLTNTAFEAVVGVRSGYSRGLGAGIKPQKGKNIAGLHEELKKECEKR